MTAPDLPMRERIAEALCEHDGWYGVPGKGAYCDCEHFLAPDGVYAVNAWKAHRADAVLAVLADLPDTAVEAGVEATRLHRVSVEHDGDYGEIVFLECRCGWGPSDNGDTPAMWAKAYAHENHERQAATIAAFKEGKA